MGRAGVTWKIGGKKTAPADAVVIAPVTLTNDSDITTRVKRILEESDSI